MLINTKYGTEDIDDFKRDSNVIDQFLPQIKAAQKLGISVFQFLHLSERHNLPPDYMAVSRSGKNSPRWSNQRIDWWVDNVLSKQYSPIKHAKTVNAEIKAAARTFVHRREKKDN